MAVERTFIDADIPGNHKNIPISLAVKLDNTVYVSGAVGLDTESGKLVDGGIAAQTRKTMSNIKTILDGAGSSLNNVVKVTVYVTDMCNFPTVNAVYKESFPDKFPARTACAVNGLPLGALVEIDVVAHIGEIVEIGKTMIKFD